MEKHFTATSYIIDLERVPGLVLLLFHPKLHKWLPPGGHVEPNETPPACAIREALEETGLQIEILSEENVWVTEWNATSLARPYLCLLENIPPHGSQPAHQHIDFIFVAKPLSGPLDRELFPEVRWFSEADVEQLKEEEIFSETRQVLHHLFTKFPSFKSFKPHALFSGDEEGTLPTRR